MKAKLLIISFFINFLILSLIYLGIQNSSNKSPIHFLSFKSVELPVGFLLGLSFIVGSTTGSTLLIVNNKNSQKAR